MKKLFKPGDLIKAFNKKADKVRSKGKKVSNKVKALI